MTREMNSKTEQSVTPEQQKKLQDKVDKCKQDVQKVPAGLGSGAPWSGWQLGAAGLGLTPLCPGAHRRRRSMRRCWTTWARPRPSTWRAWSRCLSSASSSRRSACASSGKSCWRCRSTWTCRTWPGECPSPGAWGGKVSGRRFCVELSCCSPDQGGGGLRALLRPCEVLPSRTAACWPKSDGLLPHSTSSGCRALRLGREGGPQLGLAAVTRLKSTQGQVQ